LYCGDYAITPLGTTGVAQHRAHHDRRNSLTLASGEIAAVIIPLVVGLLIA